MYRFSYTNQSTKTISLCFQVDFTNKLQTKTSLFIFWESNIIFGESDNEKKKQSRNKKIESSVT